MSPKFSHSVIIMLGALGLTGAALEMAAAQEALPPPDFEADPDDPSAEQQTQIAPESEASLERMDEVIAALDGEAQRNGNNWQFEVEDRMMLVVTDASAGRMRIMTPIAESSGLGEAAMERLMQANFDTALDARYAIGQGLIWGVFVHPLDSLTTRDFAAGVLQTKSLADTFGTTFSSGTLNYGGGDSGAIIDQQLNELLEELDRRQTT